MARGYRRLARDYSSIEIRMGIIRKAIQHPEKILPALIDGERMHWLPEKQFLRLAYRASMGKKLDLQNPKTFNEKLQWLKLYDRKPEYTIMVDKYKVRDYIKDKIGEEYLIPLIGVWDNPEDIDFDSLPNQFVLKCNHNSGLGMYICKDKSKLTANDIKKIRKNLAKGLAQNYYLAGREWPYKDVPRKIICEKYMEDESTAGALTDYKFFCFNGEVKCLYVSDCINHKMQFYDNEYNMLDIERDDHTQFETLPRKPVNFEQMKKLAQQLSKGIPHVRVDLYEINKRIYFSELTFSTCSGFIPFKDRKWDELLGSWLKLPENNA